MFPHQERLAKLRSRHQEILDQLNTQAEEAERAAEEARRRLHAPPDPTTRLDDLKTPPPDDPPIEGPSL